MFFDAEHETPSWINRIILTCLYTDRAIILLEQYLIPNMVCYHEAVLCSA